MAVGETDGDALGDGDGVEAGLPFFFVVDLLRCFVGIGVGFGVGLGRTKKFFNLAPSDSSPSCAPRAWLATAITTVVAITITERSLIFTLFPLRQGRQFLHDCLIHSDAGSEILQRKILVRRMSAAAGQGESEQECLHAENIAKIGNDRDAA